MSIRDHIKQNIPIIPVVKNGYYGNEDLDLAQDRIKLS